MKCDCGGNLYYKIEDECSLIRCTSCNYVGLNGVGLSPASRMRVLTKYDLRTHSYLLTRNINSQNYNSTEITYEQWLKHGRVRQEFFDIEITYEQWLKHERVRQEFFDMQEWIISEQAKQEREE